MAKLATYKQHGHTTPRAELRKAVKNAFKLHQRWINAAAKNNFSLKDIKEMAAQGKSYFSVQEGAVKPWYPVDRRELLPEDSFIDSGLGRWWALVHHAASTFLQNKMSEKNFTEQDEPFRLLLDRVLTDAMGSPHPPYTEAVAKGWCIRGEIHGSRHFAEMAENRAEANRLVEEIRRNPVYVTPSAMLSGSAVLPIPQGPPQVKRPRADTTLSAGTEADWGGTPDDEHPRGRPGPPGSLADPLIREASPMDTDA